MPSPLDCTDYDFSLGGEVAFGPCTPQLQSSTLVQVLPQHLSSPEPCWRNLADEHQKALGDALEANSQVGTPKASPACTGFALSHPAEETAGPCVGPAGPWTVGLSQLPFSPFVLRSCRRPSHRGRKSW